MLPKIRLLTPEDLPKLREIHDSFYKNQFEFPNFEDNYLCNFVITDENDKIIIGGGLRNTVEATILTDKNFSVRNRRIALYQVLESCEYIARRSGFPKLYVVTEDENWKRHLLKQGFLSRGDCLSVDV